MLYAGYPVAYTNVQQTPNIPASTKKATIRLPFLLRSDLHHGPRIRVIWVVLLLAWFNQVFTLDPKPHHNGGPHKDG